jgi:hypothetical protein
MHSRFLSHITAAISGMVLILITAGTSMVMFMMIARPFRAALPLQLSYLYSQGNTMAQAVAMVIGSAYCAGILAWILLFAVHRAGVQRLSNLQTIVKAID